MVWLGNHQYLKHLPNKILILQPDFVTQPQHTTMRSKNFNMIPNFEECRNNISCHTHLLVAKYREHKKVAFRIRYPFMMDL